jgi:hypothetical protein
MLNSDNISKFIIFSLAILITSLIGYWYVLSFSMGIRIILLVHGLVVLFFFFAVFLKDIKAFLTFLMLFTIPMSIDYNIVQQPVKFLYPPFVEGILVNIIDLILLVLFLFWLFKVSVSKKADMTFGYPIGIIMLLLIVYTLIAGWFKARNYVYVYYEAIAMAQGLVLFFYLINNTETVRDIKIIINAMLAGAIANSIWMILQFLSGLNYTIKGKLIPVRDDDVGFRAMGLAGGDVVAVEMVGFIIPIMLAYMLRTRNVGLKIALGLATLLGFAAIIFAKNRSGGLAVIVGVLAVLYFSGLRGWASKAAILKIVVVGTLVMLLLSPFIYSRFQKGAGSFEDVRTPLMQTAFQMWKNNWLLGVGASNYLFNINDYLPVRLRHTWFAPVHNEYLLFLAERGVIGTALHYSILIIAAIKLLRTSRSENEWISTFSVGLLGGLAGSLPFRMFHWYHQPPFFTLYCVLLALAVIFERQDSRDSLSNAAIAVRSKPAFSHRKEIGVAV